MSNVHFYALECRPRIARSPNLPSANSNFHEMKTLWCPDGLVWRRWTLSDVTLQFGPLEPHSLLPMLRLISKLTPTPAYRSIQTALWSSGMIKTTTTIITMHLLWTRFYELKCRAPYVRYYLKEKKTHTQSRSISKSVVELKMFTPQVKMT